MADDETHRQIDRAYDFADRAVEGIGRFLGVDVTDSASSSLPSGVNGTGRMIDVTSETKALPGKTTLALGAATEAAPAPTPAGWRIKEIAGRAGDVRRWVVTNGKASAECTSRAFAEQVLAAIAARGGAS